MTYDFDNIISRSGTGSLKWDKYSESDILPAWVADMDFGAAPEVLDAIHQRVDHKIFGYTIPYHSVIQEVCDYLQRVHSYTVKPEWLLWLPGLVPALNIACRAYASDDEGIMTCTPVYPPFLTAPGYQQRTLISADLKQTNNRWTFDFEAMERAITPQTRLFILCNPHNPVGRVFTDDEITALVNFCEKHDLVICSDEIHCDLILEQNLKHRVTATLSAAAAARTVTMMAPSKTYNLPGLSCAFAIIENPDLRQKFKRAATGIITEVNTFGYAGCEAAYKHGEAWRLELIDYLRANRDFMYQFIQQRLPEIEICPMEATYLAWLGIAQLNLQNPTAHFEKHGVGLSDGSFFGNKDYVRLNFGCPRATLVTALERLEQAVIATRAGKK